MKVITFYTKNIENLALKNIKNFESYCFYHNYLFKYHVFDDMSYLDCCFKKLDVIILELKNSCEDVIWIDIDVVLKNKLLTFDDIIDRKFNINVSSDDGGLCSGFMYIKNVDWSKTFFDTCFFLKKLNHSVDIKNYGRPTGDQSIIKYLYDGFDSVKSNFNLINQNVISNKKHGNVGSFAHHFWLSSDKNFDILPI